MNYIINPSWFYWISVANGLRNAFTFLGVVLLGAEVVMCIVASVHYSTGKGYGKDDPDLQTAKAMIKPIVICAVSLCASFLVSIFIPSRNTLIEMQIAKYATYENAEWTLDTIKSAVDYIVNAIQRMK